MAKHPHTVRDARKPGWFYIDGALLTHYGAVIGAYGIAVYAVLAHKAAESGSACAIIGYDRIAALIGIGRNTVIRTLRDMEQAGVIITEPQTDDFGRPIGANIYTLCALPGEQKAISRDEGVPTQGTGVPTQGTPHAAQGTGGYPHRDGGGTHTGIRHDQYHRESDSNTPTPTVRERKNGVGVGESIFTGELIERGVNPNKAAEIASSGYDRPTVLESLDNMLADGKAANRDRDQTIGNFINRLKLTPPEIGKPYARQRTAPKGEPLQATRPNVPDKAVSPAEVARRMRESR